MLRQLTRIERGRMVSQLSWFRNIHGFATLLFLNVRIHDFATFMVSQPVMVWQPFHGFATSPLFRPVLKCHGFATTVAYP